MNCSEVDELAGAFALRALPAPEAVEVEDHLSTCAVGHPGFAELLEVVSLLPFAVDDVEPPAGLRDRLVAAALADRADHRGGETAPFAAARSTAVTTASRDTAPLPIRPARRPRWPNAAELWAAAALVVLSLGLGAWNVNLHRNLDKRTDTANRQARTLAALAAGAHVVPLASQAGVQMTLVQAADGSASLVLGNVPRAPAGKVYQAWFIRDGKAVGAGVFPGDGVAVIPLQGTSSGAQLVAVTVEPAGGSPQPTSDIIAKAPLG